MPDMLPHVYCHTPPIAMGSASADSGRKSQPLSHLVHCHLDLKGITGHGNRNCFVDENKNKESPCIVSNAKQLWSVSKSSPLQGQSALHSPGAW